jgi:hypothetical protein
MLGRFMNALYKRKRERALGRWAGVNGGSKQITCHYSDMTTKVYVSQLV